MNAMTNNLTTNLNPAQKEAVVNTEGAMLVVAGAGSGKTRVLTSKIKYLLETKQIPIDEIMAVTFTNKASKEMAERIGCKLPWLGTFHSICGKLLRKHIDKLGVYSNDFTIIDTDDQKKIINNILKENSYPTEKKAALFISFISKQKNKGILPKDFNPQSNDDFLYGDIYEKYHKYLTSNNLIDFDDMLLLTNKLLSSQNDIRDYYQQKIKYLLIDEYQDTNEVQYQFAVMMSGFHRNITAVGDGDQSIYSWRGANVKNILQFEKDFKDSKIVLLEDNYRSTKTILDAANSVIKNNQIRKDKTLKPNNVIGDKIKLLFTGSAAGEAEYIAKQIKTLKKDYVYKDMAIIYRTNSQSRQLEETFVKRNIPYTLVGGTKFYARKEIKDIISYLQVISNPNNNHALSRIINIPGRGIGGVTINKYLVAAEEANISLFQALSNKLPNIGEKGFLAVYNFKVIINNLIKKSENNTLHNLIELILQMTSYREYILSNYENGEDRLDNINELIAVAEEKGSLPLADFLMEIALVADVDSYDEKVDAISLMTMHSTKGLEFPIVFISGCEEGFLPHARSTTDEQKEEERRLFYVGVTRAMEKLYLTGAAQRTVIGQTSYRLQSRFLDEIPAELIEEDTPVHDLSQASMSPINYGERNREPESYTDIEIYTGDYIEHSHFGNCKILSLSSDNEARLMLDNGKVKEVVLFAKNVVKKL